MELMFIGANHEVTGSCHCVQAAGKTILVDYGMEQGGNRFENAGLPVKPSQIDAVLVTHAHIDHTGMLPKLFQEGFTGQVLCTKESLKLCDLMLRDSAHIQMMEAEWRNKKSGRKGSADAIEPLYTMEDALGVLRLFVPHEYNKIYTLCEGIKYRFTDIGHLLGSSSIEVWLTENGEERKLVFSGDIGNKNQPLLKDPTYTEEADYVLVESTYGNRYHEKQTMDYVEALTDILRDTFARGGNVVIPAFAVGRTQVLLYYIREIKQKNLLPEFPGFQVFVDSPMAVTATEIFSEADKEYLDDEARAVLDSGVNPISFPGLELSITTDESKAINENTDPKVIISASGMCDAGRIKHHLKYNLWKPQSTVVFVGYQAEGTLGRQLVDGAETVKIFGEDITVRCKVAVLQGMSGHADKQGLLDFLHAFTTKPKKVFVVHGDDDAMQEFTQTLCSEEGLDATAPYSGSVFDLLAGTFVKEAEPVPIVKKADNNWSAPYTKLRAAEQQVSRLVADATGLPNKELEAFTKELQALYEKYRIPAPEENKK